MVVVLGEEGGRERMCVCVSVVCVTRVCASTFMYTWTLDISTCDRHTSAFALAQVAPQNRLPLDRVLCDVCVVCGVWVWVWVWVWVCVVCVM